MGSMIHRNSASLVERRVRAELLAEHRVAGRVGEALADRALDGLVGLAHRREIGLGRDLQVVRRESAPS